MFGIEHRRGQTVIQHEMCADDELEDALASAMSRAPKYGADNIRMLDSEGRELGIYRVPGPTEA